MSADVLEIFRIVEEYFRFNISNQKRKTDVQLMDSSLMGDFNIRSHLTTFRNSVSEASVDEIALSLLESMLPLYIHAKSSK